MSRFCSINRLHADIRDREPLLLGQPPVFTYLYGTIAVAEYDHGWEAWESSNLGHGIIDLNLKASFSKAHRISAIL